MILSNAIVEKILSDNLKNIELIAQKLQFGSINKDDLVQEGLIGFNDGIRKFNNNISSFNNNEFVAFCLMCAKRQMIDAVRKVNRKKHQVLNNAVSLSDSFIDSDENKLIDSPKQLFILQEEKNEPVNLEKFSLIEKKVIEMLVLGLNSQEIATKIGKSKKAVADIIYRIRKKIKGV